MSNLKVKLWKDKAFLSGEFSEVRRIALELPGFKKFINDSLMFEISGKNIEYLLSSKGIEWSEEAKDLANSHFKRIMAENEAKSAASLDSSQFDNLNFPFKTVPFDHQKKAFALSRDKEYYAYLMEMGTGKTKVVIDNAAYLFGLGKINCTVILAPNGVHSQWATEQVPTHLPDWCLTDVYCYAADNKEALKKIDACLESSKGKSKDERYLRMKFFTFNIDSLSNKKGVGYLEKILKQFNCLFVIDESVRIKTPGSLRTKSALKLASLAPYRRIMSGAPVTKGYEDLYSQLKFLHPDVLGFNSFYTFRNYYCIMGGFEGKKIIGYRPAAVKELEEKMKAYCYRVTKKECLDLPEKIYVKRYVELTAQQKELYSALKKELAIDMRYIEEMKSKPDSKVEDSALMSAITRMLRMQQVVCGHMVIEDKLLDTREVFDVDSNRIEELMSCINEAQGKVIVWCRFIHDLKKISLRLNKDGIKHRTYHGEVKQVDRTSGIEAFRNDPETKVFLAQPASGGTGLNLAVADTVIYFSNDFNADTRWQSEDRAHRIGQKNNVTYIDLISKGTIDTTILSALMSKKNIADALLDNPRRFLDEHDRIEF